MAQNPLQDWQFKDKHVDPEIFKGGRDFISSESILLFTGPATLDALNAKVDPGRGGITTGYDLLHFLGVADNVSIVQNKQLQQLFEVGSRKPYFVPGRTITQVGMSRILFNGDTLLAALGLPYDGVQAPSDVVSVDDHPGYESQSTTGKYFFMNLASSFFNNPIGLGLLFKDSEDEDAGAIYLEECRVQSHQIAFQGQQTVVMENVSIRCSNIAPIDIGAAGGVTVPGA